MFMAASSVTRYLRTNGKATRVMVWDELHVRQVTLPLACPACQAKNHLTERMRCA